MFNDFCRETFGARAENDNFDGCPDPRTAKEEYIKYWALYGATTDVRKDIAGTRYMYADGEAFPGVSTSKTHLFSLRCIQD